MNNKGFTLIELLTTLLILGVIVSLSVVTIRYNTENTMKKSEEVFIDTLRDAIDIFIDEKSSNVEIAGKTCQIDKTLGSADLFEVKIKDDDGNIVDEINFESIFNSKYKPLLEEEFVNPAYEDASCKVNTRIRIFRDSDYVYYYSVKVSDLECLKFYNSEYITNLPEGCI
ncbi:MAG: prepilin-type N-terminal cleavage/methylation domain-containing protein [Bacilli bacterium]|nr:prepilin-type N-terminal cleavage/methylation domain-containing protein [Bacilli bacterium]